MAYLSSGSSVWLYLHRKELAEWIYTEYGPQQSAIVGSYFKLMLA